MFVLLSVKSVKAAASPAARLSLKCTPAGNGPRPWRRGAGQGVGTRPPGAATPRDLGSGCRFQRGGSWEPWSLPKYLLGRGVFIRPAETVGIRPGAGELGLTLPGGGRVSPGGAPGRVHGAASGPPRAPRLGRAWERAAASGTQPASRTFPRTGSSRRAPTPALGTRCKPGRHHSSP